MHERRNGNEGEEEEKSVRGRSGRRRVLGASVVWVGLGTLAMLALLIMRRQATTEALKVEALKAYYGKARDRLGQVGAQPTEMETRKRRVMNFIAATTNRA